MKYYKIGILLLCLMTFLTVYAEDNRPKNKVKIPQICKLIDGKWLDSYLPVIIEYHYPTKIINTKWGSNNITYGEGIYNFYELRFNREIPFESGNFKLYLKEGELYLEMVNSFTNGIKRVRVDYYNKERLELFYTNYRIKSFLKKINNAIPSHIQKIVTITSDPINTAVYANQDFIGKTPLEVNLNWNSTHERIELRFEKSGFITNRRMITPQENNIHIVLQPIW